MTITTFFRASATRWAGLLPVAGLVFGLAPSAALGQWRENIWAGDNSYAQCKRDVSAKFQDCLRTNPIMNPGDRYAACDVQWKEDMANCWTSFKMELAARGGNWNPASNPSSGPLGQPSSGPLYPPSSQPLSGPVRGNFVPSALPRSPRTESSVTPRLRSSRTYRSSASPTKRSYKSASTTTRGKITKSKRASYKAPSNRSYKVSSKKTRSTSSGGRRGPHQSGGLIRDPAPVIRR